MERICPKMGSTATPPLVAAFDFDWVERQTQHVINLLQQQGPAAKQTVSDILTTIKFFTGKQFVQAFLMLQTDIQDVQGIIAAIKAEWAN